MHNPVLHHFHETAKKGDVDGLREFVEMDLVDINSMDREGNTALYYACENNQVKIVKYLLKQKVNTELSGNKHGLNPLCIATVKENLEIVKILLSDRRCKVDYKSSEGKTALWLAAEIGSLAIVKELIHHGANLTEYTHNKQITPLWIACQNGHYPVVKYLITEGADVNFRKHNQATPLIIASQKGHQNIVSLLLANGADVNVTRFDQSTALHLAVYKGHEGTADLLLNNRADIEAVWWINSLTPLHIAIIQGDKQMVDLLLRNKANTGSRTAEGATPLCIAAYFNHTDILSQLLESDVDVEAKTLSGDTALTIACFMNNIESLKKLCYWGADINARDNEGNTGLHVASQESHSRIVKYLLENNAKISLNKSGQTPTQLAKLTGKKINKNLEKLEKSLNLSRDDEEDVKACKIPEIQICSKNEASKDEVKECTESTENVVVSTLYKRQTAESSSEPNSFYAQIATLLKEQQQKNKSTAARHVNSILNGSTNLTDKQLLHIAMAVGNQWKVLAGLLNIPYTDVLQLALSSPQDDVAFKGWTMLILWRDMTPTISGLLKKFQLKMALFNLGMPYLQRIIDNDEPC